VTQVKARQLVTEAFKTSKTFKINVQNKGYSSRKLKTQKVLKFYKNSKIQSGGGSSETSVFTDANASPLLKRVHFQQHKNPN
jgi:hypothetical protein